MPQMWLHCLPTPRKPVLTKETMCFKLGSAYPKLICIGGGGGAWPGATLHLQALQGWARHFKLPRSLWSMYHEGSSSPPSTAVVNSEERRLQSGYVLLLCSKDRPLDGTGDKV